MLKAIIHSVSPLIGRCELTFIEREPIDLELAIRQHHDYCAMLERHGAAVIRLTGNESYPDSCFVEDTAIVLDEIAIMCSPGVESRRGEVALIERELSKHKETVHISLPSTIEGGDVLKVGKTIFVGESKRTNAKGIEDLRRLTGGFRYKVVSVETRGSLHLKSAVTSIDDETLLVNKDWIDVEPLRGFRLVHTPASEPWSANVLRVNNAVCVQSSFPETAELIENIHGPIDVIDTSELRKAEGSLTCMSILF